MNLPTIRTPTHPSRRFLLEGSRTYSFSPLRIISAPWPFTQCGKSIVWLNSACGNKAFPHDNIYAACVLSSKEWFWETDKCNFLHENDLKEELDLLSPCHYHVIILITKNVDNRMPPKVWEWNQWQSKDFVSWMCVSRTKSTSTRRPANNQASAEYHIYINSEVGIPILRS